MKRKLRKSIHILVTIALIISFLEGCAEKPTFENALSSTSTVSNTKKLSAPSDKYVLDLIVRDKKVKSKWSDTRVGKIMSEKFNMDFNLSQFTGNYEQQETLWLAGGDYPEIMTIDKDFILNKYISAGAVYCLDDYFAQYGKNILNRHAARLADYKSSKYTNDGKLYWIGYWSPDMSFKTNPPYQMAIRSDVIDAVNPARLLTSSDYIDFFKKAMEILPKDSEGKKSVGISMPLGKSWGMDVSSLMFGTGAPFHQFTGRDLVTFDYSKKQYVPVLTKVPEYKQGLKFFNQLYRIGALDKESFTDSYEQFSNKMKSGSPMGTYFCKWDMDGVFNPAIREKGIAYIDMPFMLDDTFKTNPVQYINPFDESLADPNLALVITKNCKYPERIVKLLDYIASEEGQVLLGWGEEGIDYEIKDGKRVPIAATITKSQNDPDYWLKQGIIEPLDMLGLTATTDANGQNYVMKLDSEFTKLFMSDIKKRIYAKYGWVSPMDPWLKNKDFRVEFPAMPVKFVPDPTSDIGKSITFWQDYRYKMLAKLYLARDDEEFESIWVEFVKVFNDQNPEAVAKEFNMYMNKHTK